MHFEHPAIQDSAHLIISLQRMFLVLSLTLSEEARASEGSAVGLSVTRPAGVYLMLPIATPDLEPNLHFRFETAILGIALSWCWLFKCVHQEPHSV